MELTQLFHEVGLWPGVALILCYWIDKIRREQIAERDQRITKLELEAEKTVQAKNAELAEWKHIALSNRTRTAK